MKIKAFDKPVDVIVDGAVTGKPVLIREFSMGPFREFVRHQAGGTDEDTDEMVYAAMKCVVTADLKPAFTREQIAEDISRDQVLDLYSAVLELNFGQSES